MSVRTFTDLAATPATHFTLQFYSAVAWLLAGLSERRTDRARLDERFPFLEGYERELARRETARLTPREAAEWWRDAVAQWEDAFPGFLPVRAIADAAGLERDAVRLLFAAGLVEEDARFGLVFEALDPLQGRRPTAGILAELRSARRRRFARTLLRPAAARVCRPTLTVIDPHLTPPPRLRCARSDHRTL